jgi:hypothetical protein
VHTCTQTDGCHIAHTRTQLQSERRQSCDHIHTIYTRAYLHTCTCIHTHTCTHTQLIQDKLQQSERRRRVLTQRLKDAEAAHEKALKDKESEHAALVTALEQRLSLSQSEHEQDMNAMEQEWRNRMSELEATCQATLSETQKMYEHRLKKCEDESQRLRQQHISYSSPTSSPSQRNARLEKQRKDEHEQSEQALASLRSDLDAQKEKARELQELLDVAEKKLQQVGAHAALAQHTADVRHAEVCVCVDVCTFMECVLCMHVIHKCMHEINLHIHIHNTHQAHASRDWHTYMHTYIHKYIRIRMHLHSLYTSNSCVKRLPYIHIYIHKYMYTYICMPNAEEP